jgi:anti-anti-sigma regulatory factor
MVGGDAAFKLRDEVKRQREARVVLIDLSELGFLGRDVVRVLVLLQAWARVVGIQFKLFDPSPVVRQSLQRLGSTAEFEIALTDDVLSLLHWAGPRNGIIQSLNKAPGLNAA